MNLDQRIRLIIGDLLINQANLACQLEECQKENAELKEKKNTDKKAKET